MSDYNSRDIFFSSKEYRSKYNTLLNSFLSKHEDFDEINFIENELEEDCRQYSQTLKWTLNTFSPSKRRRTVRTSIKLLESS